MKEIISVAYALKAKSDCLSGLSLKIGFEECEKIKWCLPSDNKIKSDEQEGYQIVF